ncbi:MAG: agmatinase [Chloroflexi bacterium]|nr:agmatinase [Chloroflexota bacterium]
MPGSPLAGLTTLPWSFAGLDGPRAEYDTAAVAVLSVPYDSTTSYRTGSREGPKAIINASRFLELYEPDLDLEPASWGIATLPELRPDISGPAAMLDMVTTACRALLRDGKLVVMLGGEHSLTIGSVRAAREAFPNLSVLQLDAHGDLRDSYMGSKFSHGSTMRRVREMCTSVSQVGIRSISLEERDFLRAAGITVPIYTEGDLLRPDALSAALEPLTDTVYITIDLDALDPGIIPATGTPEPGGMTWIETLTLLRAVAQRSRIIGFDIVELAPDEGSVHSSYTAARLTYKLMGYALALGPGARTKADALP